MLVLPLLASPLWAAQALNIYSAKTLVKNQSEAERNRAARATLGEVVVRVSGQSSALSSPEVQQALGSAQNFLYGFSYAASSEQILEGDKSFPAMEVQLNYSPESIQQLLRQAQLPLWPAQRPKVLVWLVVEDQAGIRVDSDEVRLASLRKAASYRGLPLSLPSVDAALGVPAGRLWQFDIAEIERLSQSYRADAVLIGRYRPLALDGSIPPASYEITADASLALEQASIPTQSNDAQNASSVAGDGALPVEVVAPQGPWIVDWQLLRGDEHQAWNGQVADMGVELADQLNKLADIFAQEYAVMPNAQGPQVMTLHIGGISDFASFKRAQAYLSGLAMVKQVEVEKVDASGLLVKLAIEGDIKLLISTLALGKKLQPENAQTVLDILNKGAAPVISTAAEVQDEAALAAELDAAIARENGIEDGPSANQDLAVTAENSEAASLPLNNGPAPGSENNPLAYLWKP